MKGLYKYKQELQYCPSLFILIFQYFKGQKLHQISHIQQNKFYKNLGSQQVCSCLLETFKPSFLVHTDNLNTQLHSAAFENFTTQTDLHFPQDRYQKHKSYVCRTPMQQLGIISFNDILCEHNIFEIHSDKFKRTTLPSNKSFDTF